LALFGAHRKEGTWIPRAANWDRSDFSKTDIEEATLRLMKMSLLQLCTAKALTDTKRVTEPGFYRHATQHGERSFFAPANSLAALMLLVGWVRELKWLSEKHPELFQE
jgi:hypothetical protein